MRLLQRLSAAAGWAIVAGTGLLLILEATSVIDDQWRVEIATIVENLAAPTMSRWLAALVGLAFAAAAVAVAVAQAVPYQRSSGRGILVDRSAAGDLLVRNRAIETALAELLRSVDGVSKATALMERRRIHAQVQLSDTADVTSVAAAAREIIDTDLWSRTGLDPSRVDLTFQYRRAQTRVNA